MVASETLAARLRDLIADQQVETLCAIIDAAADVELAREARLTLRLPSRMLFQGEAAQYMHDVAPWLVTFPADHPFLEHWAAHWGRNAGILFWSHEPHSTVLRHLRTIFITRDDSGQEYFFRFYDPRVLQAFLPTCDATQLKEFFGPIRAFLLEGDKKSECLIFSADPKAENLIVESHPFAD